MKRKRLPTWCRSRGGRGREPWLRDILKSKLGSQFPDFVKIAFEDVGGRDVCLVRVAPGYDPAFNGDTRIGNQTPDLPYRDAVEFARARWPK